MMNELYIETNHGFLHLRDVELREMELTGTSYEGRGWKVARGTVIAGSETSRLFHATSTKRETPGEIQECPLYGRKPYCTDEAADKWYVSCVTCG
jgi:hypothetical protein